MGFKPAVDALAENSSASDLDTMTGESSRVVSATLTTEYANDEVKKEKHLAEDIEKGLIVPSPIPFLPKSLALSWANFEKYYGTYGYLDGERMEVASRLVASLLDFYFQKPKFNLARLPYQVNRLIKSIRPEGTTYWVVTTEDEDFVDEGLGPEMMSRTSREPTGDIKVQSSVSSSIILLVAIATHKDFRDRRERGGSSQPSFSDAVAKVPGSITINGQEFRQGHVVILGSKSNPVQPSLEFYIHRKTSKDMRELTPWNGEVETLPGELATNSLSFRLEDAEMVDQMFKRILGCARGDYDLLPAQNPLCPTLVSSPAMSDVTKTDSDDVGEPSRLELNDSVYYLRGLKLNKAGRLIDGWTGRLLNKVAEDKAKELARTYGVTFASPRGRPRKQR